MTSESNIEYKLIQQRIEHERELREENAKSLQVALDLQAKEYERRLEALNNAYRKAEVDRAMFVKQEIYDIRARMIDDWREQHIKENDEWKLNISTELAVRRGEEAQTRRSWMIVTIVSTLVINLVALVLAFMIHNAR